MSDQLRPAAAPGIPTSDLDPFSGDFLTDPLPHEAALRDLGPVVWLERYGAYALARFDEVSQAMKDWESFSSAHGVGVYDVQQGDHERPALHLLEMDPPDHTALRQVHNTVLTPRFVRGLRDDFRAAARKLIGQLVGAGTVDGVAEIATAYPMSVFPDLMGVRPDGRENMLPAATVTFEAFGPPNELLQASLERGGAAMQWLVEQAKPGATAPDGVAAKIHATGADLGHPEDITMALAFGLLTAGLDTTVNALGFTLYHLATNPAEWQKLKADPGLPRIAFEEAVRLGSPVKWFGRHTTRDVPIGDVVIPADSHVLLFLGSANRDPRHWDDPERYDLGRRTAGHVGFGAGVHGCVGQQVARMEGEAVVTALAELAREIRLTGEPTYLQGNTLRGLTTLPLTIEA
jgi:4-methoxybenzoate monooxygenase (O-demethylating)